MSQIAVNGVSLHFEVRGSGPPVLFVSGATGDAGHWAGAAEALSDEFTVLTYDRRSNSRSSGPPEGTEAPLGEQADDAAALLAELDLAPAVAYGSSSGAIYVTDLLLRHADVLTGAVMHEPPLIPVTSNPPAVGSTLGTLIADGMARGGPPAAMAAFLQGMVGDVAYASYSPELIARCVGNAEVFFGLEMPAMKPYLPDRARLAQVEVPCVVAVGEENAAPGSPLHWLCESSAWLAGALSVELTRSPGGHAPQASHPQPFVDWLRPVLRSMTATVLT